MDKKENIFKQHVILSKEGIPASIFDVEEVFNKVKNETIINTSSELLLDRLRLAVKNKEIEPFNVTVIDLDGEEYISSISASGSVCCCEDNNSNRDIYESKALRVRLSLLMALVGE